jgi:iron complex transport system substrate-binding protein
MPLNKHLLLFILFIHFSPMALAEDISVIDDSGQTIHLTQTAQRVISLSPGLTELVFASGGGNYLKGVVSFSDYPPAAKQLPQVGRYNALDMEQILMLEPDLVIAWQSGNPAHQLEQLKNLGLIVYLSEPHELMDIPKTMRHLGQLMGTQSIAEQQANTFIKQLKILQQQAQSDSSMHKKKTFIQIWNKPVMSVNQQHLISKVISLCGGENIFAQTQTATQSLTLTPTIESILEHNPEIIIATGMADSSKQWLQRWQQWPYLDAVKNKRLYAVNPDHLVRHTPRILQGIKAVCQFMNH